MIATGRPTDVRRQTKRFWRRFLLNTALVIVLGVGALISSMARPDPDLALILRVNPGMTETEVVDIFGASPVTRTPWQTGSVFPPSGPNEKYWYCDAAIVWVSFGNDGLVRSASSLSYRLAGEHPAKRKLRRALSRVGLGSLVP
jgi:hypothetical protein